MNTLKIHDICTSGFGDTFHEPFSIFDLCKRANCHYKLDFARKQSASTYTGQPVKDFSPNIEL